MAAQLVLRHARWSVKYTVPAALARAVGKAQVWRSTGERDRRAAEKKMYGIVADIVADLERQAAASSPAVQTPADLMATIKSLLAPGGVTTAGDEDDARETAEGLATDAIERFMAAHGFTPDDDMPTSGPLSVALKTARAHLGGHLLASTAAEKYLAAMTVKPTTLTRTRSVLEGFILAVGDPMLDELDRAMVGRWFTDDLPKLDLAPATARLVLRKLVSWFKWCVETGLTERSNPFTGLGKRIKGSSKATRAWTPAEVECIKTLPHDDRRYKALALAALTGCRIEEVCQLKVSDVHQDERWLAVAGTKTASSARQVPIARAAEALMARLIKESTDGYLVPGLVASGEDVRRSKRLVALAGQWIRRAVGKDPTLKLHGLRSTFVHLAETASVPEATVKLLVGHARQSLTFGLYSRSPGLPALIEAVDKLPLPVFE